MKEHAERIALRLPAEQRQQCEQMIQKGKATNLSELMRRALQEYLKTH